MSILCSMVGASFITAAAEVIRRKVGVTAIGNAQVDTAQSKFGGASALFDGTGDYLTSPNNFMQAGDFTFECWFRINSGTTNAGIITIGNESSGRQVVYIAAGNVLALNPYGGSNTIQSATALSTGVWYHMALVRSGSTATLYQDGVNKGTAASAGTFGNVNGIKIAEGLNGWADEIRVSNSARYTANFTPSTSPFVNDDNTLLLIHANGTDAITFFEDDNGVGRSASGVTAFGNAKISTAQSKFSGSSALFDGTGDYIRALGSNFTFSTNQDFTVETWVYITGTSNTRAFFTLVNGTTVRAVLYITSTQLSLYSPDLGGLSLGDFPSANTWHHMALSRSGNTTKVFFNGTETYSTTSSWNASSDRLLLGTDGESSVTNPYIGYIDEVRISNNARYTSGFTPSTTPFTNDANTLLLLHMDGTNTSTVFRDDNGIGRTQKGISALGNAQVDTAQSKFGGASGLFDGNSDYLTMPHNTDFEFGANDFTVEFWARHSAVSTYNVVAAVWQSGSSESQVSWIVSTSWNNSKLTFIYAVGGSSFTTTFGSDTTGTNVWNHYAITRTGGKIYGFKDGVLLNSGGTTFTSTLNAGIVPFYVGALGATTFAHNGHIDELRVSNSARYTASFTAPTAPFQNDANTLLLLHMDGTDASTVFIDDNGRRPT